ncbi:MAG: glycosyl hydrolase family 18 protein [Planctomycetota bacterium]
MKILQQIHFTPILVVAAGVALGVVVHEFSGAGESVGEPKPGETPSPEVVPSAGDHEASTTEKGTPPESENDRAEFRNIQQNDTAANEETTDPKWNLDDVNVAPATGPDGNSVTPPAAEGNGSEKLPTVAIREQSARYLQTRAPLTFREIWGYVYGGEEKYWTESLPITDLCLFNYQVDDTGRLVGKVNPHFLRRVRARGVRTHLVVAAASKKALFHFLFSPDYPHRRRFQKSLVDLAGKHPIDGFQLDFEGLRKEDYKNFVGFLRELKSALPARLVFSLALPARTKSAPHFHYRDFAELADRLFIMGYDFHWGGGDPGAVAPRKWLDQVLQHALTEIPRERLVFGLPFYGRVWQEQKIARATKFSDLETVIGAEGVRDLKYRYDLDTSHRATFTRQVSGEVWFDDAATLYSKLASARALGARSIGFWRLGQEDPEVWSTLRTNAR